MSDDFWKHFWKWLMIAITCVILSFVGCTMHIDYCIKKSIEAGADPIDSKIAFSQNATTTQMVTSKFLEVIKDKK